MDGVLVLLLATCLAHVLISGLQHALQPLVLLTVLAPSASCHASMRHGRAVESAPVLLLNWEVANKVAGPSQPFSNSPLRNASFVCYQLACFMSRTACLSACTGGCT